MSAFGELDRLEHRVAELEAMNDQLGLDLHDVSKRLATAEADRDDYEQRWLAECRAHGETKRKLDAGARPLTPNQWGLLEMLFRAATAVRCTDPANKRAALALLERGFVAHTGARFTYRITRSGATALETRVK